VAFHPGSAQVTTLSHHYYFGGPATNPDVNIPNLLKPATMQRVEKTVNIVTAAASKIGARARMTEGNTCYRGGKPGVSDVFAAALWSADFAQHLVLSLIAKPLLDLRWLIHL
jgi:hypothetical protein